MTSPVFTRENVPSVSSTSGYIGFSVRARTIATMPGSGVNVFAISTGFSIESRAVEDANFATWTLLTLRSPESREPFADLLRARAARRIAMLHGRARVEEREDVLLEGGVKLLELLERQLGDIQALLRAVLH